MYGLRGWEEHKREIKGLRGRLGFPDGDALSFLGLRLSLIDGSIYDELRDRKLNPSNPEEKALIGAIYQILSAYSKAKEKPLTGRLITSRQISGGQFCHIMVERAKRLLLDTFRDARELLEAARLIGGEEAKLDLEGAAIQMRPLPLIPVVIIFRAGDEEFQAEISIFYDGNVEGYLDLENLGILTLLSAIRLRDAHRKMREKTLLELLSEHEKT
ncbi:DUF3786 domain-containing protein [Candidatus Bathyarchaeota archaeon]|nr:DUF3786 domain-containing protein [Candidatus Bathyarchaeota archaeon]